MIRKGILEDIDHILRIETASFAGPWSRASFEAEFLKDFSHIFVFEDMSILVGYIIVWDMGSEGEILNFAVDDKFRHKHIASQLLEYIFNEAFSQKKTWFLEVSVENIPALKLYEKYSFVKTGIIKNYYGYEKHAFRMARSDGRNMNR